MLIASGQKPDDLKIPGTEYLTDSEQFLELEQLPQRIVFIGGGYIAFEFAHIALSADAQGTIVHRGVRPLPLLDPGLVDQLVKHTRELGTDVQLGSEAVGVQKHDNGLTVRTSTAGAQRTMQALIFNW